MRRGREKCQLCLNSIGGSGRKYRLVGSIARVGCVDVWSEDFEKGSFTQSWMIAGTAGKWSPYCSCACSGMESQAAVT